jgi:hypothetical protein
MAPQFWIGLANATNRRFDRLGHHHTRTL